MINIDRMEASTIFVAELESVLQHINIIDEAVYNLQEKTALISNGLANRSVIQLITYLNGFLRG